MACSSGRWPSGSVREYRGMRPGNAWRETSGWTTNGSVSRTDHVPCTSPEFLIGVGNVDKFSRIISVIYLFQCVRAILHITLFMNSGAKAVIATDIHRWIQALHEHKYEELPEWRGLVWLLWRYPEYRNLFYCRIKNERRFTSRVVMEISRLFFAPMDTLYIRTNEIDAGLFIQHGYCTDISAQKVGKNCWINQQVVIGYSDWGKCPTIGDNVQIKTGAKIFGDITIGDNSIIGANAVVLKNVPPDCTVVGVPGYIVKRNGQKVKEPL
jgi:serine O-acetyltransferase